MLWLNVCQSAYYGALADECKPYPLFNIKHCYVNIKVHKIMAFNWGDGNEKGK